MAHVRRQIRDAVVTALTGLSSTGARVSATRKYTHGKASLPALAVYTLDEESESETLGTAGLLARSLRLVVTGYARASNSVEDTLDQIAAEVEAALAGEPTLGGLAKRSTLIGTEIEIEEQAEQPIGSIRLIWRVDYLTAADAPQTAL